jgi:hypothetical protein
MEQDCKISENGLLCAMLKKYQDWWMHEKLGENCLRVDKEEKDGNQQRMFG